MVLELLALTQVAHDPGALARSWGEVLEREPEPDGDGVLLRGSATQVGLRFAPHRGRRVGPNRVHLHLTSEHADQGSVVAAVLAAGGTHLDVGQRPEEGHVVLADPEGNELCVIEPGNGYLAGTGRLGELACDGTRAVGLFWSEALGWPLVWDQDEQTVVQSPAGGTKVAWGGPPVAPLHVPARQWLELVTDDVPGEARRLVALGATRPGPSDDLLADPDGNELRLRPRP